MTGLVVHNEVALPAVLAGAARARHRRAARHVRRRGVPAGRRRRSAAAAHVRRHPRHPDRRRRRRDGDAAARPRQTRPRRACSRPELTVRATTARALIARRPPRSTRSGRRSSSVTTTSARRPAASAPRSRRPRTSAGTVAAASTASSSGTPAATTVRTTSSRCAVPPAIAPALRRSARRRRRRAPPSGRAGTSRRACPAAAIASVTSAIEPAPSRSNTDRTVASARCVPSATSSTTSSPRAAAARHAAIGPGSRWCSGRMPLNRCVAVRRRFVAGRQQVEPAVDRRVHLLRRRVGVADRRDHADVDEGRQDLVGDAGHLGGDGHGDEVAAGGARRVARTSAASPTSMSAGFCAPQRSADRNGPSRWMPTISPASARSGEQRGPLEQDVARGRDQRRDQARRAVPPVLVDRAPAPSSASTRVREARAAAAVAVQVDQARAGSCRRSAAGSVHAGGRPSDGPTQTIVASSTTTTPVVDDASGGDQASAQDEGVSLTGPSFPMAALAPCASGPRVSAPARRAPAGPPARAAGADRPLGSGDERDQPRAGDQDVAHRDAERDRQDRADQREGQRRAPTPAACHRQQVRVSTARPGTPTSPTGTHADQRAPTGQQAERRQTRRRTHRRRDDQRHDQRRAR